VRHFSDFWRLTEGEDSRVCWLLIRCRRALTAVISRSISFIALHSLNFIHASVEWFTLSLWSDSSGRLSQPKIFPQRAVAIKTPTRMCKTSSFEKLQTKSLKLALRNEKYNFWSVFLFITTKPNKTFKHFHHLKALKIYLFGIQHHFMRQNREEIFCWWWRKKTTSIFFSFRTFFFHFYLQNFYIRHSKIIPQTPMEREW
jgi:hypothetical protein